MIPYCQILRSSIRRCAALLSCFMVVVCVQAQAETEVARFEAANKLFEQGQFAAAAAGYEAMIKQGEVSASVWFNLGNSRFRMGETGKAIAAYRNASVLAPRDPDIRANLVFARAAVPGNPGIRDSLMERALASLSLNEWARLAAVLLWCWFGLLALRRIKPSLGLALRTPLICLGFGLAVATILVGAAFSQARQRSGVVVVADQAPVRFGPLAESQTAFTARNGAEFPILERKDGWLMVADPSRKTGWMEAGSVVVVPGY